MDDLQQHWEGPSRALTVGFSRVQAEEAGGGDRRTNSKAKGL